MSSASAKDGVFINCPFDLGYRPIFDAIVFTICVCGFRARSALEVIDSGELRLTKIMRLIKDCRFSIHDLSRVELDAENDLPRFNMPIELGIAMGLKEYSRRAHTLLILDSERFRYQKFASDLAGLDIAAHGNIVERAIPRVRNFLAVAQSALPTGDVIVEFYRQFELALPALSAAAKQSVAELTFSDRARHIDNFIAFAGT